jgi:maleate cis-trans isomerase
MREIVAPWFQLGYVIPHLYTDLDAYQFYRVAPEGAMLVTTQLDLAGYEVANVERELPTFWNRVELLGRRPIDTIALSGVPIAAALGRARILELLAEVTDRTGKPASTDVEAHIEALHHLGVSRLALGSRWPQAVVEALSGYLADAGIGVVAVRARGRSLDALKAADPMTQHELALDLGREVLRAAPDAEGLMLPGGLWFAIHAAPILEEEFGIPVTLNITATLWSALNRRAGELPRRPDPSWGRLLASL